MGGFKRRRPRGQPRQVGPEGKDSGARGEQVSNHDANAADTKGKEGEGEPSGDPEPNDEATAGATAAQNLRELQKLRARARGTATLGLGSSKNLSGKAGAASDSAKAREDRGTHEQQPELVGGLNNKWAVSVGEQQGEEMENPQMVAYIQAKLEEREREEKQREALVGQERQQQEREREWEREREEEKEREKQEQQASKLMLDENELYRLTSHLKPLKKDGGAGGANANANEEEELRGAPIAWNTGIAEVQLPDEYKMRNIEATENAARALRIRQQQFAIRRGGTAAAAAAATAGSHSSSTTGDQTTGDEMFRVGRGNMSTNFIAHRRQAARDRKELMGRLFGKHDGAKGGAGSTAKGDGSNNTAGGSERRRYKARNAPSDDKILRQFVRKDNKRLRGK